MADGPVYRAVFLRMHPTGKAVLSLSEASQGQEASLAETAAAELGIPPEDIKVVHEDTDRFGEGNSFNAAPSDAVGENVAITARKLRDKAQLDRGLDARGRAGHAGVGRQRALVRAAARPSASRTVALRAFGGDSLPDGIEGSLDAQTAYRLDAPQPAG